MSFLNQYDATRLLDGCQNRIFVKWSQRPQINNFDIDAFFSQFIRSCQAFLNHVAVRNN